MRILFTGVVIAAFKDSDNYAKKTQLSSEKNIHLGLKEFVNGLK